MTSPMRVSLFAALTLTLPVTLQAAPLAWSPCTDGVLPGSLCATGTVPASYETSADSGTPALSLFVRKIAADVPAGSAPKGTLWLVAGGPGESGASFYALMPTLRRSFPGFQFLLPDHRGTGNSARVCPAEEAADSPGGRALAGAEWASCFASLNKNPQLASQFSITNAAHDLRTLITSEAGVSAQPVYLYGVSYGTQLVLRSLQLGPLAVKGVLLDSLVPPQTDPRWDLSQRSQVVNQVGLQVLADCDNNAACHAVAGEPAQALLRRVLAKVQADPALLAKIPGKNLKNFLGSMLDVPSARTRLIALLRDLEHGGDTELAAVRASLVAAAASLGSSAQSPLSIPLVSMISNSENNLQPTLRPAWTTAELDQEESALLFTSPLPRMLAGGGLPTYPRDAYFGQLPANVPPMLVLQGTHDPKTPYAGAVAQLQSLQATSSNRPALVSVQQAPHFILWTAAACFETASRRFVAGQPAQDCAL